MNSSATNSAAETDILVIGAGFSGIYAVFAARRLGYDVLGVEAGSDVGGTWYWNRYPGARCDVESLDYSYSFDADLQREWRWSERYATQPEIHAYIRHVADRFKLRQHFSFNERVLSARFDEARAVWIATTDKGRTIEARYVIFAGGSLSTPIKPNIPGIDDFAGEMHFTAKWPETSAEFKGKRVAVIGTGSSGIQSIPIIARSASHVTVLQRSANYSVPVLNVDLSDETWEREQATYMERRRKSFASGGGSPHEMHSFEAWSVDDAEREVLFEKGWQNGGVLFGKLFPNQTVDDEVNALARDFVERKIRSIVRNPDVAKNLTPTDHPIGTKRICTDSGYYDTFNRENVSLVNLRNEQIVRIHAGGITTTEREIPLDMLVIATGFDAMTGTLTRVDITGPRGDKLAETWAGGPTTFLGAMVPGFPNLFNICGPGSPSILSNVVLAAEQQLNFLLELIRSAEAKGFTMVEARRDAADAWTSHCAELADKTLFTKAPSWYMGANIEGKPRKFMPYIGGFGTYSRHCEDVRGADYKGMMFSS